MGETVVASVEKKKAVLRARKGSTVPVFQITETICPVGYTWSDSGTRCEDNNNMDDDGNGNGNGNSNSNSNNIVPSILILSDTTLTLDEGCNETYTITLRSPA